MNEQIKQLRERIIGTVLDSNYKFHRGKGEAVLDQILFEEMAKMQVDRLPSVGLNTYFVVDADSFRIGCETLRDMLGTMKIVHDKPINNELFDYIERLVSASFEQKESPEFIIGFRSAE